MITKNDLTSAIGILAGIMLTTAATNAWSLVLGLVLTIINTYFFLHD